MDVTAVVALPLAGFRALEDQSGVDVGGQFAIAGFVPLLDFRNLAEYRGDFREAFGVGDVSELRIEFAPFLVLAGGGGQQVQLGVAHGDGIGRVNRDRFFIQASDEKFEEPFGVFLLILRCFRKNIADLHKALFLGDRRIIGIAGAGLRFAGECFHQIFRGFAAFEIFHWIHSPSKYNTLLLYHRLVDWGNLPRS